MTLVRSGSVCALLSLALFASYMGGAHSVAPNRVRNASPPPVMTQPQVMAPHQRPTPRDFSRATMTNAGSVPFSELYDLLRAAPDEQILRWAGELEHTKANPRQTAAITAFYSALVQVNAKLAARALVQTKNLKVRDIALTAAFNTAPESEWSTLAEMMTQLPYWGRRRRAEDTQDFVWYWAQSDPQAATEFVLRNEPPKAEDDQQFYMPVYTWAGLDPRAAREWLEAHPETMIPHTIRALLDGWETKDRAGAIAYAIQNAAEPRFRQGIDELANTLLRKAPDECREMVLSMPEDAAAACVKGIADITTAVILHASPDYQRPAADVADWMVSLPVNVWKTSVGDVVANWYRDDASQVRNWLSTLPAERRDAVALDWCKTGSPPWNANEEEKLAYLRDVLSAGLAIRDDRVREEAMAGFAEGTKYHPQDALQIVDGLHISTQQKQHLREVIQATAATAE